MGLEILPFSGRVFRGDVSSVSPAAVWGAAGRILFCWVLAVLLLEAGLELAPTCLAS